MMKKGDLNAAKLGLNSQMFNKFIAATRVKMRKEVHNSPQQLVSLFFSIIPIPDSWLRLL